MRSSAIPQLLFFALFPALFFYATLVARSWIPPVIGGGFGVLSLLAVGALFWPTAQRLASLKGGALVYALTALVFFVYVSAWCAIHVTGLPVSEILDSWAPTLVGWLALFAIGVLWPTRPAAWFTPALLLAFAAISLLTMLFFEGPAIVYGPSQVQLEEAATYQFYGRCAAVTVVALMALLERPIQVFSIALIGLVVTLLIGARSEFAGLLVVVFVALPRLFRARKLSLLAGILLACSAMVAAVVYAGDTLADTRIAQIFGESLAVRLNTLNEAIWAISQAPLLGDFMGHDGGLYAHNIISAWRQLGFFGFVNYLTLCFVPVLVAISALLLKPAAMERPVIRMTAYTAVFCLVLVAFAKSLFAPLPALAWGLTVSALTPSQRPRSDKAVH